MATKNKPTKATKATKATKVIKEIMAIKVEIMAIKEALVTYVVMSFLAKVIIMDIVAQRDVIL